MNASGEIDTPLTRRKIVTLTLSAAAVAALLLFAAVLPAEYGSDPTGLGRATGIARLWSPDEVNVSANAGGIAAQRSETLPFRTDTIRIPLSEADDMFGHNQLEYKVRMKKGSTLVYSWSVPDMPAGEGATFWTELHGHTVANGKTMTVVEYRKAGGLADAGALTASIDGVHGWFVRNPTLNKVTMELKLAGFYTLVPPGEVGNEAMIVPVGAPPPPLPE